MKLSDDEMEFSAEDMVLSELLREPQAVAAIREKRGRRSVLLLTLACCCLGTVVGCKGTGRTIEEDHPVFAAAPPRRTLDSRAADETELAAITPQPGGPIQQVGFEQLQQGTLTGNTIVAVVNGKPLFLDDVLGSVRFRIENQPQWTVYEKQMAFAEALQGRLPQAIDDEIVVSALTVKIPKDRQEALRGVMEAPFRKVLDSIKADKQLTTDEELEALLAQEGESIANLRETFIRHQMVDGFLTMLAQPPQKIDRVELVRYYQAHRSEYTSVERLRVAEIVVRFEEHGGRAGAEDIMVEVVNRLKAGESFGAVAASLSDALSGQKRGDLGWITAGTFADREFEQALFAMPVGGMTQVYVRDDRFEVYHVADHEFPETKPLPELQDEIEEKLLAEAAKRMKKVELETLRERAVVVTIFDQLPASQRPAMP